VCKQNTYNTEGRWNVIGTRGPRREYLAEKWRAPEAFLWELQGLIKCCVFIPYLMFVVLYQNLKSKLLHFKKGTLAPLLPQIKGPCRGVKRLSKWRGLVTNVGYELKQK